ncbi:MAG: beta-lactamase family protein [Verrucomicrobia bacterium]|nr:beta-lactamase family protein [Verrucomicrobiota bacterium]
MMTHPVEVKRAARKLPLVCAAIIFTASLSAKDTPAPPEFGAVREFIQQGIASNRAPSVAVAVIRNDRVVWAEGFGFADIETKQPATSDSVYLLASVSKPIAATGLMLLVDQGKIALDRPANDYLPRAKFTARAGRAEDITVRRLLNHTAGLPVHANFFRDGFTAPPRDETIRRYGFAHTPPGTRWEYCNLAFGVIDYLTELAAKKPWGKFMEEKLYDPLGMKHTSDRVRRSVSRDATTQYRYDVAGRFVRVPPYGFDHDGASAVWSSANDLARFLQLHLNDGVLDGKRFFKPGTLRAMQTFSAARSPDSPERGYGLGFFTEPYFGHRTFGHSGGMPGVSTFIRAFPDDRAGFVVLLNASSYGAANAAGFRDEIYRGITRVLLPGAKEDEPAKPARTLPPAKPDAFAGRWRGIMAHFDGDIPLAVEVAADGKVLVNFGAQPAVELGRVSFRGGQLTGQMEGVLNTQPSHHGAVNLEFRLRPVEGALTGLCVAEAEGYFALSHWVKLERVK